MIALLVLLATHLPGTFQLPTALTPMWIWGIMLCFVLPPVGVLVLLLLAFGYVAS